ncbi:MAG: TIGR04100 family radical SAM protein [Clostridia bacterium]|nr:TIGR04100 family radical SAM protein [Clostridia bacterium]
MTISYVLGNSLYLNLTNKCPNNCDFCVRNNTDHLGDAESLWLEREPSHGEIINDLEKRDLDSFDSIVFCGYGEPLERLDEVVEVSKYIRSRTDKPIRINTNGLSDLINGKNSAERLRGLVDIVSISLNASDSEKYDEVCHSVYGRKAFGAMLEFASASKKFIPRVILSVVDTIGAEEIEKCRAIAREIGVEYRVREYIE